MRGMSGINKILPRAAIAMMLMATLVLASCELFLAPSAWSAARASKALLNAILIASWDLKVTDTLSATTVPYTLTREFKANDGSVDTKFSVDVANDGTKYVLTGSGTVTIRDYYDREHGYTINGNLTTSYSMQDPTFVSIDNAAVLYSGKLSYSGGPVNSVDCSFTILKGELSGGSLTINGSKFKAGPATP
jgi:hypothetical protein